MNPSRSPIPHMTITVDKLRILLVIILGAVCIATLPAFSQTAKPNFSGRWELDKAKSDFDSGPAPNDILEQINQTANSVVITTTFVIPNGEIKKLERLKTDGTPTVTTIRGHESTSMTHWQGASLVAVTREPNAHVLTETRSLSNDGKVMTIIVTSGSNRQKVVMLKKKARL